MTLDATSPQGVTVTFTANASDGADPSPSVTCNPASGSMFAIGAQIVACTATDHVGNAAHQSFGVSVRGAKEQLNRLIQSVIAASKLPAAAKAQVLELLRAALAGIDLNKPAQRQLVCTTLTAFATVVRLDSGHGISPAQADQWITDAKRIRAVIGS